MEKSRKTFHQDIPDVWDCLMRRNGSILIQAFHHESKMVIQKLIAGKSTLSEKRAVGNFLVEVGAVQLTVKHDQIADEALSTVEVYCNTTYPVSTPNTTDAQRHVAEDREEQNSTKRTTATEIAGTPIQATSETETKYEPLPDIGTEDLGSSAADAFDDGKVVNDDDDDYVGGSFDIDEDDLNDVEQSQEVTVEQSQEVTFTAKEDSCVDRAENNTPTDTGTRQANVDTIPSEIGTRQGDIDTRKANHDARPADTGKNLVDVVLHYCTLCNATFPTQWELDLHAVYCKYQTSATMQYSCHMCDKTYQARGNISYHLLSTHGLTIAEIVEEIPSLRGPVKRKSRVKGRWSQTKKKAELTSNEAGASTSDKNINKDSSGKITRSSSRKRTKVARLSGKEDSSDESHKSSERKVSWSHKNKSSKKRKVNVEEPDTNNCGVSYSGHSERASLQRGLRSRRHPVKNRSGEDQDFSEKEEHHADVIGSSADITESSRSSDEPKQMEEDSRVAEAGDTPNIGGSFQEACIAMNNSNKVVNSAHSRSDNDKFSNERNSQEKGEVKEGEVSDVLDQENDEESSEKSVAQKENLSQNSFTKNQACEPSGKEKSRGRKTECRLCGAKFSKRMNVHLHMSQVHFKDSYKCNTCGKVCKGIRAYTTHLKRHGEPSDPKQTKEFIRPELKVTKVCPFCSKTYEVERCYRKHLAEHEADSRSANFICKICDKKLSSKGALQKHMNYLHTKEKKYPCTYCDRVFYQKHPFNSHMKGHTDGRQWKCDLCDQAFVEKWQMEGHKKRVHFDTQSFLCDLCGTTYKSLGSLTQHHKTAHTDTFNFHCDTCGKKFKRRSHFNTHMKVHNDDRPHKCELCEKAFRTRTKLAVHIKWHNNERDFKCSLCDKCFLTKGNLDKHMQIHQKTKAHCCTECEYVCVDYTTLRKHLATKHNIIVESKLTQGAYSYRSAKWKGSKKAANSVNNEPVGEKNPTYTSNSPTEDDHASDSLPITPVEVGVPVNRSMSTTVINAPDDDRNGGRDLNDVSNSPTKDDLTTNSLQGISVEDGAVAGNYPYTGEITKPACDEEGQDIATLAFMNMMLH